MKFEVRPGRDFEGITVVVTVEPEKKSLSFKKFAIIMVITVVFGTVVASLGYGAATGDYSIAKAIAESGKNLVVDVAAKMAAN